MADVAVTVKIMPASPEVDLENLASLIEEALPGEASLRAVEHEDVAFGLVALVASIIVADAEGGTEAVESAIADLDDVESVSIENVGRL